MSYVIQMLPKQEELDVIKKALREFTTNHTEGEGTDVAWGILADIHKKEIDDRDRENRKRSI